jgi:hypothetical protein
MKSREGAKAEAKKREGNCKMEIAKCKTQIGRGAALHFEICILQFAIPN